MPETASPTTHLNMLIRQAEIQQQQMKLEVQFQKNMALFKQFARPIYDEYINYKPQELHLSYDETGYINLINSKNGKPVYNEDPRIFCQRQLSDYRRLPTRFKIDFAPPPEKYFFQLPIVHDLVNTLGDDIRGTKADLTKPIGMMMINGCGLGYHIPALVESTEIYTLCVFDPHKDSFYACLHTIDWAPIVKYFYRPGRLLKLFIDSTSSNAMTAVRLMTNQIGLHNITNTYAYTHLQSPQTIEFANVLKKQFHLALTGTGFLEDEQVSIAHTIDNINRGVATLNSREPLQDLPPAIIVGNGPSLDGLIEPLKRLSKDAVVFSCGTTTGTLYRNGIVPDFHVEMERIGSTTARIERGTDQAYRNKIALLALNTVAPETMALFNAKYMAKKINDPGEHIIDTEFGEPMPYLNLSNPTCTNTGLAYALRLGFKEIYLFGVDLGMQDESKHHASDSQYYDNENKPLFAESEKRVNIRRPGNFGGEVITTAIMDTSRANMELALELYSDVTVYNPNNGAAIKGTITIPPEEIKIPIGGRGEHIVKRLLQHNFTAPPNKKPTTEKDVKKRYLIPFFNFRKKLNLPDKVESASQVQQTLNHIWGEVNGLKNHHPVAYWLLSGSIQTFFTLILKGALAANNKDELSRNYHIAREAYELFLKKAYALMRDNSLKHHDVNVDFTLKPY